ncbi:MAG: pyridoxamine 5'-phosphate oxidase family protein [Deltaproteobacteria bacterium]|jgi:nitroimidazol reductase NimA-like FMN-containing flavoprotein (pyridoxamine 5'-phosphate oxidase superfamily)|nr:pyridoxamine 5'-phosphate oxidase family protein [Deltaproteobacteria bacterium]
MRRKHKEITDKKEIEKILKKSQICHIAMVDKDKPYIVPMNFGYENKTLFFHCALEGRKINLIKKNPNLCFEVDQVVQFKKAKLACDWSIEYKSVIGEGRAQLLYDPEEKREALDIIMAQYSGRTFEYPSEMLEKTLVIKLVIDKMTGKQS